MTATSSGSPWSAEDMTPAMLAGQRLMVGFDGTTANDDIKAVISEFQVGGVIFFARNLKGPEQVMTLLGDLAAFARDQGLPPLFLSVDQEGGVVKRLAPPFAQFPGNPFISSDGQADQFARMCGRDLLEVGFNMNLAPVLDVAPVEGESIMARRAFPGRFYDVARLGARVIKGFQDQGLWAVAKHFPGIGRTVLDSHLDLPYCHVAEKELWEEDLKPFAAAIEQNVAGVMLTHVIFPDLDPDWPAGFSTIIARDLLRGRMGFEGLVLTDDLDMGAVCGRFPMELCMDRVLAADVDQALICHPGPDIEIAARRLLHQIEKDSQIRDRARQSAARILKYKENL